MKFSNTKKNFFMLIMLLLLSGCASSSPWAGIPVQERQSWKQIGINAYNAKIFRQNAFSYYDVAPWVQQGINSPTTIIKWHRAGFEPYEASKWIEKRFPIKEAVSLKKRGVSPN